MWCTLWGGCHRGWMPLSTLTEAEIVTGSSAQYEEKERVMGTYCTTRRLPYEAHECSKTHLMFGCGVMAACHLVNSFQWCRRGSISRTKTADPHRNALRLASLYQARDNLLWNQNDCWRHSVWVADGRQRKKKRKKSSCGQISRVVRYSQEPRLRALAIDDHVKHLPLAGTWKHDLEDLGTKNDVQLWNKSQILSRHLGFVVILKLSHFNSPGGPSFLACGNLLICSQTVACATFDQASNCLLDPDLGIESF